jgi:hypothetical protein
VLLPIHQKKTPEKSSTPNNTTEACGSASLYYLLTIPSKQNLALLAQQTPGIPSLSLSQNEFH